MNYNQIGQYVLVDSNENKYPLAFGTNIVSNANGQLLIGEIIEYAPSFLINIKEKEIKVQVINGRIEINGYHIVDSSQIEDKSTITIDEKVYSFLFDYNESMIETIIDIFMDGNLDYPINMERLFLDYAKKLKISDRNAISNMMAIIDIPEIDKL